MGDFYMLTSRTVDGTEYLTDFGWVPSRRSALIMTRKVAEAICLREIEREEKSERDVDDGRYSISVVPWIDHVLYTIEDYERAVRDIEEDEIPNIMISDEGDAYVDGIITNGLAQVLANQRSMMQMLGALAVEKKFTVAATELARRSAETQSMIHTEKPSREEGRGGKRDGK